MIDARQPIRYGSKKLARSRALILAIRHRKPPETCLRDHMACFGNKGHYQSKTGICIHVEATLAAALTPWRRARARFHAVRG